jgi:uncharacterized protein (TIGR00730 family)
MLKSVCVFCGSSFGNDKAYIQAAEVVGGLLCEQEIELVYGGGNVGLMGTVADACLRGGGKVTGVIPKALADKEIAHTGLTELVIVSSMHERKALMADRADAFMALPGGYGTWEEFIEVLTWSQLGLQKKACGVLNINGYYDPLLALANRAVADEFLKPIHRSLLLEDTEAGSLLEKLKHYVPVTSDKWIGR